MCLAGACALYCIVGDFAEYRKQPATPGPVTSIRIPLDFGTGRVMHVDGGCTGG